MIARMLSSLWLVVVSPAVAGAQGPAPVRVPDAPTCPRCTIAATVVATLGTADGPGALSGRPYVIADGRGRYWAFVHDVPPMVFDAKGGFVRQVGAMGQGPGEFSSPMSGMATPGDSVLVLDGYGQRGTMIGPDLEIARLFRLPVEIIDGVAIHWPDDIIASGTIRTAEANGRPLHRVSLAGSTAVVTRHFGPVDPSSRPGVPAQTVWLSAAKPDGMWSAEAREYRLTLWSANGEPLRILERKPPWFAVRSTGGGSPTTPPQPSIAAIREDPNTGWLWVLARVAAPTWRDAWPPQATAPGVSEISGKSIAYEKMYDTRIEVLDTRAGRVMAQGQLKGMVLNALPGNRVATYVVDTAGYPHINLVALRLVPR
jgi:6-bladed beta-propeller